MKSIREPDIISGKIRRLPKADRKPQVLCRPGEPVYLSVQRNGYNTCVQISRHVAEELIAMGCAYGS
jgi:hypothetical protein